MSLNAIKGLLEQNGFNFKKMFGQNFIVDENIIHAILNRTKIDQETLVIEIGPGAGALTSQLSLQASQVLCYEIDATLKPILDVVLSDRKNVEIRYQDFLTSNVKEDLNHYRYQKLSVIANLPYYITTPIIMKFIEEQIPVDEIVIMVQKEVGNRFKAQPGSKDYNSLSIFLQYHFTITKLLDISRNVFLPKPNVDSIVVCFQKRKEKLYVKDELLFFQLVKDAFRQKRKTLKNNLKDYNLEKIEFVLKQHQLDLSVRAEALSIELFVEIANQLS